MYDLSIVIPAYNEEKKIVKDIEAVYKFFNENSFNGELVIVDDGSSDDTKKIVQSQIKNYPNLKLVDYGENKGKGYALRKGMVEAQGKYILFADSGLCVPFKCALQGIELLKDGSDIAIGSRRGKNNESTIVIQQPLYRRAGSKVFYFLIKAINLIPKGIYDTQCGFKLFKKEAAHKIYSECFTDGFMIDIESLRRAVKLNYKVTPFSIEWSNDPDTRYNPLFGSFQNLLQIVNILLKT